MATPAISINPNLTTNAAGSFPGTSTVGVIQGVAYDNPASRYQLAGGILASTETLPMWGGVAITEDLATPGSPNPSGTLGGLIKRATGLTGSGQVTGFSVFNQNHAAIITPSSEVPLTPSGGLVNFYRFGSLAQVPVACDPSLASLDGGTIAQQVSWDWVNQLLVPYIGTLTISSGTYNNTTGIVTLTMSAPITFSAGDAIIVSSLTGSNITSQNGTYTAIAPTSGTTVTYQATAAAGATTITGGSLTLGSGASSALPVKVLEVSASGNMTVNYNSALNTANWNRSGSAAVIVL